MSVNAEFHPLNRQRPLRNAIVRQIEHQIIQGHLHPGERLPTETELCDQFNVSRTVVREALLILRQLGLVEARRGVGTFVSESVSERVSDAVVRLLEVKQVSVWNVHELREILEPALAALAAQRAEKRDLQKIMTALDAMKQNLDDRDAFIEADLDFHAAIAAGAKNPAFRVILTPLMDVLLESRMLGSTIPGSVDIATKHHESIVDHIRAGDPAGARESMLEHIQQVRRHIHEATQLTADPEDIA